MLDPSKVGWIAAIVGGLAIAATGCQTEAYCFVDCGDTTTATTTGTGTGGTGGDCGLLGNCGGGGTGGGTAGTTSSGGTTDCGDNFDDPHSCGTCKNNCFETALNCKPATIGCTPSANPGTTPGVCTCGECATDYYDLDKNGTCEYACQKTANDDKLCNLKDDDCDGTKDEDVDLCNDPKNCGKCGRTCSVIHGSGGCVKTGNDPTCSDANTSCKLAACDCNGPGDCWWDLDGSIATGCEYQCDVTNGGVEICDGLDNDCDGKIDAADDLSSDPTIGAVCYGDPDGLCATAAHAGVTVCQGGLPVCTGPNLLKENQTLETCNGVDDDCDGQIDDSPTDVGGSCGVSAIFPCAFGSNQCVGGMLMCVGAVLPATETCNGVDDDCDGTPDKTNGMPPADSIGACNVPPNPPAGATSPCQAGMKSCSPGGIVTCNGSKGPTSNTDACGDDSNCDGVLTNQPDFMSDVHHCGNCATDCQANAIHTITSCVNGQCMNQGCEANFYDLDGNGTCEYACTFTSATELCNGKDDDCDGQTDENVTVPSPVQVCGVSGSALSPECTSGVTVMCQMGAWKCTFPAGVCANGCSNDDEICDALDNDCDGFVNENVANWNKPCASDDGLPAPGHGACRTTGTFVCSGNNATTCSAMKADCNNLPGGCTELCDGVDNDCDGIVDEPFSNKGANAANFVKPIVTKISAAPNLWIYTYEASRPTATNQVSGTGNGYWTSGPQGSTLDKTPACSAATKIPWFNVSPQEASQTCNAMGGALCTTAQWQTACKPNAACLYGYNPRGAAGSACATGYVAGSKFCNLGPSFDFNSGVAGDQDGLLPTASASLTNCWADWSALNGNVATNNKLYDLTGNLREIVFEAGTVYKLMGGAFDSKPEAGSACTFTFYSVDQNYQFFDTGFRCCFTQDPTL